MLDEADNIMVYGAKAEAMDVYNQNGQIINTIDDQEGRVYGTFFNGSRFREKPNGIIYENVDGTITKTENGVTTVVFTVPEWQKEASFLNIILIILIIATVLLVVWRAARRLIKKDKGAELLRRSSK